MTMTTSWSRRTPQLTTGRFGNGALFAAWGAGDKDMIWMPGGPGGSLPSPSMHRFMARTFRPLTDAGYRMWWTTRPRGMPEGHTVADMADDYATVIKDEFGGRVDVVAGVSYGGMVGQHLAARHPETFGTIALVATGWRVSDWGLRIDRGLAEATAHADAAELGRVFASFVFPDDRLELLRRLAAPAFSRMIPEDKIAADDDASRVALVEWHAEESYDPRPVLPQITVPVLLVAGDRDRAFERDVVMETAALIPHCTLVWYRGRGHMGASTDRRLGRDVLAFARATEHRVTAR
jgi:pimeloyl-ACP methyl ester carboxylesterase